jgi:hypothetical protein
MKKVGLKYAAFKKCRGLFLEGSKSFRNLSPAVHRLLGVAT